MLSRNLLVALSVALIAAPSSARPQSKETIKLNKPDAKSKTAPAMNSNNFGTVHFHTTVGSFKILGGGDSPAQGKLEVSFHGTLLVSGLKGKVTPSGNVRLEKDYKPQKKQVFFGTGKIVVEGSYNAVQFFGRDLEGVFTGFGAMRLYGEFDRKLETGEYWYEGKERRPWGTGGMTLLVPEPGAIDMKKEIKIKVVPSSKGAGTTEKTKGKG